MEKGEKKKDEEGGNIREEKGKRYPSWGKGKRGGRCLDVNLPRTD